MSDFIKLAKEILGEAAVLCDEPLSAHSTFKIGGPTDVFLRPETEEELLSLIEAAKRTGTEFFVLGGGSNVLFSDKGFRGAVISTLGLRGVEIDGTRIKAGAGVTMPLLSARAGKNALAGMVFMCGIPGTVGGGVFMNAGAHGGEISNILVSSRYLDTASGRINELSASEHEFSYRHSSYMEHPERIILSATFELSTGDAEVLRADAECILRQRAAKQPLDFPSAGSVFKRYPGFFTAQLIDECGLKGFSVGGAQVSEKHAGFIINRGGATASDVLSLISHIKATVKEKHSIDIECEIRFVGEK